MVGLIGRNGAGKTTLLETCFHASRVRRPGFAEIYGRVGSLLEVGTEFPSRIDRPAKTFI